MSCDRIDERLLHLTAAQSIPEFSAEELEHIGTCVRCRREVGERTAAYGRIARASAVSGPDASYWASILPRIREKAGNRESPRVWFVRPGFAASFMPAAAVIVIAILLSAVALKPPANLTGGEILATLSEAELYELKQSNKDTGLLEPVDSNGAVETSLAEFIADLLSEDGEESLYALSDPEEVLHQVDDPQFTEIVSMLGAK